MNENKIKDALANWKDLQLAISALSGKEYVPSYGELTSILEQSLSIFKLCPFSINDLVVLSKAPLIDKDNAPGWMGARHFLKRGAKGIVKDREFYDGKFIIYVEFLEDSYINHLGNKVKSEKPAWYRMSAEYFKLSTDGRKCTVVE